MTEKTDLRSLEEGELAGLLAGLGQPAFRAGQVFSWLHQKRVASIGEMTNLSKELRAQLEERCRVETLAIERKQVSRLDGTVKYLFRLWDGNHVEAVLMQYRHGSSLCISTQVGCRMGCTFCASTLGGLVRNLSPGEMLSEVYEAQRDSGRRIDSIVLMGIGEPLDNYENVMKFLRLVSHPGGLNLGARHISLSTCGIVPMIDRLAEEKSQITLSISLHASNDEKRSRLMPVNRQYPLGELMAACQRYFAKTGRRISFEYALIAGVNDGREDADELQGLLGGWVAHINLIPVNPVRERAYARGSRESVFRFQQMLRQRGLNATIRRELGGDISAACGQLRRDRDQEEAEHV